MKTDIDKLKNLLGCWNVKYEYKAYKRNYQQAQMINVGEKNYPIINFVFEEDGSFRFMGVYE